ncbi:MAG TPA: hypothetical protein VKU38_21185, partial [Ktedonobacteraceae bacterium]|nr:hypothetical protein [Ktedonobacteraceae bacterium]
MSYQDGHTYMTLLLLFIKNTGLRPFTTSLPIGYNMYDDKKDALLLIFITHIAARGAELAE